MGPQPTYGDLWQWVLCTYGQDSRRTTLQELRNLEPVNHGKLTAEAWRVYSQEFLLRLERLEGVGEEEVLDIPLTRIPDGIRMPLMRAEQRDSLINLW